MSTTQKRKQKVEGTESNKRLRIENNVVNKGERLTNLRTIEVEHENTEIELDLDWDKRIKQHRQEIEQEEQELSQRLQYKAIREQSWKLNRLNRKFLEENDKDWALGKEKRG